jgi:NADPH-dependent curcumin reductase CurA
MNYNAGVLSTTTRNQNRMALQTRQNPETGALEVLVENQWQSFDEYRKRQIDEAYQSSVKFLRERLGEDAAREALEKPAESAF